MAGSTLIAIPVIIFFLLVQRKIAFGLTAGAVRDERGRARRPPPRRASSRRSTATAAPDWLTGLLAQGLGGVVLFARNVERPGAGHGADGGRSRGRTRRRARRDRRGGRRRDAARGRRAGARSPGNLALGAVDDVALTRARRGGDRRRARGASGSTSTSRRSPTWSSIPRAPIVGVRSFGSDPALVARHVAAFVEGLQSAGVAACAKHFPGPRRRRRRLAPRAAGRRGRLGNAARGERCRRSGGGRGRRPRDHDRARPRSGAGHRPGDAEQAADRAAARRSSASKAS